jgi:hypothetical protein
VGLALDPFLGVPQRLNRGHNPVHTTHDTPFDQSCFLKRLDMFGDSRKGAPKTRRQDRDRQRLASHLLHDPSPYGVRKG